MSSPDLVMSAVSLTNRESVIRREVADPESPTDSTMLNPTKGRPHLELWNSCWDALQSLRPAFSRHDTFMWFATAVVGMMVRSDLLGALWSGHKQVRAAHWPQSTLLHRAGIVNRFLDFLVREELIASNPIADLRAEYRARSDKAILRALQLNQPRSGAGVTTAVPAVR
jgi:hypothetical protein